MNFSLHDESNQVLLLIVVPGIFILLFVLRDLFFGRRRAEQGGGVSYFPSLALRGAVLGLIAIFIGEGIAAVGHHNFLMMAEALAVVELFFEYPFTVDISDLGIAWHTPWASKSVDWSSIATFRYKRWWYSERLLLISTTGERLELLKSFYPQFDEMLATIGQQLDRHHHRADAPEHWNLFSLVHWVARAAVAAVLSYNIAILHK